MIETVRFQRVWSFRFICHTYNQQHQNELIRVSKRDICFWLCKCNICKGRFWCDDSLCVSSASLGNLIENHKQNIS